MRSRISNLLESPDREYSIIILTCLGLTLAYVFPQTGIFLICVSLLGSLPTIWEGFKSIFRFTITIEAFNTFALAISFLTGEFKSAAFIVLMLSFAGILDWRTESRTRNAVEELLALKPRTALKMKGEKTEEVPADSLQEGDIIVIESGLRVPADGIVVHGNAYINESPVTGESVPVLKAVGDKIVSGTLGDSGAVQVKVTHVGQESTLERMAKLIGEAAKNKSKSQRIADRFAGMFLPAVLVLGIATYLITRNTGMTAALFLVACADDMAVAIPLAVNAAIGSAAKRGIVIKGGEWLDVLSRVKTVVLDKTGTLTYGAFSFSEAHIEKGVDEKEFWNLVGSVEKYSEHPVGRAIFAEALKQVSKFPDTDSLVTLKGAGVEAKIGSRTVLVGDDDILKDQSDEVRKQALQALATHRAKAQTVALVLIDGEFAGSIGIADKPRPEAKESIQKLKALGIEKILVFTGDGKEVADIIAGSLGVDEVHASLSPEDKLRKIEAVPGPVIMVGDGINDAPALARADVGIAMGGGGTAVAVEAADIVILTDNLSRLPEMIQLGKRTASVIRWDIVIWLITNVTGFVLVLTGFVGPALAAFYNFATDFLPLINSTRLFRKQR